MNPKPLQNSEPDPALLQIVERLDSPNMEKRREAESALRELGPAVFVPLLTLLEAEARQKARKQPPSPVVTMASKTEDTKSRSPWKGMVFPIAWLLQITFTLIRILNDPRFAGGLLGFFLYVMMPIFIILVMIMLLEVLIAPHSFHSDAIHTFARIHGIRAIGPLLEGLEATRLASLRKAIEDELVALLPRLRASDAALLDSRQRALLYRKSASTNRVDLRVAILQALAQIGDAEALPFVQRMAGPAKVYLYGERVHNAAQDCLSSLQEKATLDRDRTTLLRAACSPDDPESLLLRPARDSGEVEESLLLRPGDAPET